jgi:hypothetical protein
MERRRTRGMGFLFPVLIPLFVLGGPHGPASASPAVPSGWAVLIENDWYGGVYPDLPVGYANSTRMLEALIHRGWPADHILLIRDDVDPAVLRHSLGWLATHARPGDTALLYVAGEYYYFANVLHWNSEFRALWQALPTSHRVLIAETCFAERLARTAWGIPGLALPAVGADEWDLWGLRGAGRLIRGGAFTYFLASALAAQPDGTPLAFAGAFHDALVGTRAYFRAVLREVPEALAAFHARGARPEDVPQFPNPHLLEVDGAAQRSVVDQPL